MIHNTSGTSKPPLTVFLQPKGLLHRFIRHKDVSTIVERPERLRAVCVGIAAAAAKIEEENKNIRSKSILPSRLSASELLADDIVDALNKLDITDIDKRQSSAFTVQTSTRLVDLYTDEAVRFIHGEPGEYIAKLHDWAAQSEDQIRKGDSEIPSNLSQGDLYLCSQSIEAMRGAAAAVYEAVDSVMYSTSARLELRSPALEQDLARSVPAQAPAFLPSLNEARSPASPIMTSDLSLLPLPPSPPPGASGPPVASRAFVAIRPPGHHCSDEQPSGFCFINNVLIGVAHAHLRHGITRAIVLDIDLHHGNGSQSISWSINAESAGKDAESQARSQAGLEPLPPRLKVFYGSLHDILSFPCEDGEAALVQAASTALSGAHGQYIENVHLEPYQSEEDFFRRLYPKYRDRLFDAASNFLLATSASPQNDSTAIFISAGFDASPHEHAYMSRHNRNVPTAFYTRFARDAVSFAEKHADGRLISVLEGGYSDRALISGAGAFIDGLATHSADASNEGTWWNLEHLELLEKLTKPPPRIAKPRPSKTATSDSEPSWLSRTREILSTFDPNFLNPLPPLPNLRPPGRSGAAPRTSPPDRMSLRERKKVNPSSTQQTPSSSPSQSKSAARKGTGVSSSRSTPSEKVSSVRPGKVTKSSNKVEETVLPAVTALFTRGVSDVTGASPPISREGTFGPSSQQPLMIRIKVPPRPPTQP